MDKGQKTIGIVAIAKLAASAIVSFAGPAGPTRSLSDTAEKSNAAMPADGTRS